MHLNRVALVPLTLLCLAIALPALAQAPRRTAPLPAVAQTSGGIVRGVDVSGNQRIETDTIRSYMLLQTGDPFDGDRLDRSLRTLFATGLFRDVQVARVGDRIQVTVVENPIVNRVAFEGNRKVNDDILRPEVQLRARSVFTAQAAQADRQRILDLYARRGRFNATVEPKIIELDQNRVDVVFEITEGDPALVSRISFVGNEAFSDSRLKEVVATREAAWYRPWSTSDTYEPERLGFDRELLRRYYLRRGYADINVTGAVAELAPDRGSFFITYTLDEGVRYRVTKIEVMSRLRNVEADVLRPVIDISIGDWYDGEAVERAAQAIADEANLRGAPFVEVRPRIERNRETGSIELLFDVVEGPRNFVERIDITGNNRTQDHVIRREMRIAEGDAFNAAQVRRSRQRLRDLGYFSDVQIQATPGSAQDRAVLTTQVVERATGEVSIGGGYSTDAGFLADVGLRERNLLGTGVDARINATLAQRRSQLDFSLTDPQFLDRNMAVGLDLFYLNRNLLNYASYQERRYGVVLRMGYEFNENLRQSWSYSLVNRNVYDVQSNASIYIKEQAGTTLLSQISTTMTYDRRDSRVDPRSGYVVRLGTDYAGLGGDVDYIRFRGDAVFYQPLERLLGDPDFVLAIAGSFGVLNTIGGNEGRIVDRFFLGGDNLRGFRVAGASPRDVSANDALGGTKLWTQSTEFRFPLPIPAELGISGRVFMDAGGNWDIPAGPNIADDSTPRVGVGFGISWRSPFGLLNLDFAQAVVKQSYDETQIFRFGFGTRF